MIPVKMKTEPADFDANIRQPGNKYLSTFTNVPSSIDLEKKPLWRKCTEQLRQAHNGHCAYIAHYIPYGVGNYTVDHYVPKAGSFGNYKLTYEWSNFRFSCGLANSLKNEFNDVIDPFVVQKDWFIMDFPSLVIKANKSLDAGIQRKIVATIERLKLNIKPEFTRLRFESIKYYCEGVITFQHLQNIAPFIAYELERQNLRELIKTYFI